MSNRTELESKLAREIHYLPIDVMEAMLQLALSIKKTSLPDVIDQSDDFSGFIAKASAGDARTVASQSAGTALKNFLKKYESDPVDIDTSFFEQDRATDTDRDFRL